MIWKFLDNKFVQGFWAGFMVGAVAAFSIAMAVS